jgi:hypothetical protein
MLLMGIEEQRAKQRQGTRTDLTSGTSSSNELKVEKGQARDIVARQIGLSPTNAR